MHHRFDTTLAQLRQDLAARLDPDSIHAACRQVHQISEIQRFATTGVPLVHAQRLPAGPRSNKPAQAGSGSWTQAIKGAHKLVPSQMATCSTGILRYRFCRTLAWCHSTKPSPLATNAVEWAGTEARFDDAMMNVYRRVLRNVLTTTANRLCGWTE